MTNLQAFARHAVNIWFTTCMLLLAGCSGEPSNADISKALNVNAAQGAAGMERLSPGSSRTFMPTLHDVKKLGCQKDGAAYRCDVEMDVTSQGTRAKVPATYRFVSGSDGWAVTR